jgi:hypothetical protein
MITLREKLRDRISMYDETWPASRIADDVLDVISEHIATDPEIRVLVAKAIKECAGYTISPALAVLIDLAQALKEQR